MDKEIEIYLEKVSRGLEIPQDDKNDIIQEIRSHIYEAISRQETSQKVLQRLGNPAKLAQSYNNSYSLENNKLRPADIFRSVTFYSSAAFSGIIIIPVLSCISVTFILTAVFVMGIAVLNMIGITNLPFNLGFTPVTGIGQIIMALIISIILCLIANASWVGLKKYIKFVSDNYRKMRMRK